MAAASSSTTSKNISKTYQKKTDREHILDAPDTYIGSIEPDNVLNWTYDETQDKMVHKEFSWIPGLYKCFDEGIVNARDHVIRMEQKIKNNEAKIIPVKSIDITIDKETGVISMFNDGNGIDIIEHPEYKLWIPEMIFGHLRTSTNYNKDEKKIVGGKNGFGFKLVLIYSLWGSIETVDHVRGLKYVQEFKNNLSEICKPTITKCKSKPYTKVSWLPDYKRFGIENLTDDMYNLLKKRTYDISAVTDKTVKVKFNSNLIPIKTFEQYVDMYVGGKKDTQRIYERADERWEYAVCLTPVDEFTQVSFVNGIYTSKGGKHVEYILNQIIKKLTDFIEKKKKIKVKPATIKEQLMLFVNCVIENPAFDSQTKDYMNTTVAKFGSSCKISDKFIEKLAKLGIMDQALSLTEVKDTKEAKKTDGKKTRSIRGIPKLDDANYAGTLKSIDCTLILCEGDSAKAGVKSGLSSEDRNFIGIYPLKGKVMNVRDATIKKIADNNEITELKKILGLETNKKYKSIEDVKQSLRYGKVMFLTDQDLDGSHIKGLCINLFDSQWNDLVKVDNFLSFMNTPILKARKGNKEINFYNDKEYNDWKKLNNDGKGWTIKYYKGLGTSVAKEFKQYFAEKKQVSFKYTGEECTEAIDMVFNKNRANDRKEWLYNYDMNNSLDTTHNSISYKDFVDKELIHFSKYDCDRSIPNLMDGLKISLRKILYCAFKRNLTSEIKVAQFGGYVSEHSGYHHGEKSLMEAIAGMAQEYVGSNNIALLMPNGQFGTRLLGGKDKASERYIFTQLNPIARKIFPEFDLPVLNYLDDDGTLVEPDFYTPIIPMILVNGSTGVGTGFSSTFMSYNPRQIISYLKDVLENNKMELEHNIEKDIKIDPYYEGFTGTIIPLDDVQDKYLFKGSYEVVKKDVLRITELPIGTWTEPYKEFLEKLIDSGNSGTSSGAVSVSTGASNVGAKTKKPKKVEAIIKDYKDMSTDAKVDILVTFESGMLDKLLNKQTSGSTSKKSNKEENESVKSDDMNTHLNELEKTLNLYTTKRSSNMYVFDKDNKLVKFDNIYDLIKNYMGVRLNMYTIRKTYMLEKLQRDVTLLSNKARFIEMQCDNKIDLRRKKKEQVIDMLKENGFDMIDNDEEYKYLRTMHIDSVIEENILKLRNDRDEKMKEYNILKETAITQMWMNELNDLENAYEKYVEERRARELGIECDVKSTSKKSSNTTKKSVVVSKKKIAVKKSNLILVE
jgi:DNA topoisomerase II